MASLPSPRVRERVLRGRAFLASARRRTDAWLPTEAPERALPHERTLAALLLVAAVAFQLFYLRSDLTRSAQDLNDSVFHLLNLERAAQALSHGGDPTDSWLSQIDLGFPVPHYYQHLPYVLPAVVHALTQVDVEALFRWTTYLLLSLFPLSTYWAVRRFGFGYLEAGMAGLACGVIATDGLFGFELNSYVWRGYGLYTQLWGMLLLGPTLAQSAYAMRTGRGLGLAAALLAATALSHLAFGYIAIGSCALFVLAAPSLREAWLRTRRGALLGLLFALMTAYFLWPLLRDSAYLNRSVWDAPWKFDSFGARWVFGHLVTGQLFDFGRLPVLTALVGVGALSCAARWREERYRLLLLITVFWLLAYCGRPTWGLLFDLTPVSDSFHLHRLIAGVHVGGIALIGIALAAPLRWAAARGSLRMVAFAGAAVIALMVPAYGERVNYLRGNTDLIATSAQAYDAEREELDAIVGTLRGLPPGRVFAGLAGQWGGGYRVGGARMEAYLVSARLDTVGLLWFTWSLNGDVQVLLDEARFEQWDLLNLRYVVAPEERAFPSFVQPIAQFGRHRLYQLQTTGFVAIVRSDVAFEGDRSNWYEGASTWFAGGAPAAREFPTVLFPGHSRGIDLPMLPMSAVATYQPPTTPPPRGTVTGERVGDNRYEATVTLEQPATVMLKVTYHPNWHAYVDGSPVATSMLFPSYIGIPMAAGTHDVRFVYRSRTSRHVLLFVAIAVALALAASALRAWLRGRRGPAAHDGDGGAGRPPVWTAHAAPGARGGRDSPTDSADPGRVAAPPTSEASATAEPGVAAATSRMASAVAAMAGSPAARRRARLATRAAMRAANHRVRTAMLAAVHRTRPRAASAAALASATVVAAVREGRHRWRALLTVLLAAAAIRVLLIPLYAYGVGESLDERAWARWMATIDREGALNIFRAPDIDYVAYQWVLGLLAAVYGWMGGAYVEFPPQPGQYSPYPFPLHVLMKMPSLVFDLLLVLAAYSAVRLLAPSLSARRLAVAAAAIVAFHPAVLYVGVPWAQVDASIAAAMLLAVVLVAKDRPSWGWAVWVAGFLLKPQPIVILPVLAVLTYRRAGPRALLRGAAVALVITLVVLVPWLLHGELQRIVSIYVGNFTSRQYSAGLSAQAFNLWWPVAVGWGPLPRDAVFSALPLLTYRVVGLALSAAAALVASLYVWKRPTAMRALVGAAYLVFAFYMLPTSSHERYLYALFALLLPVVLIERRWLALYVLASITFTLNLLLVAPPLHALSGRWNESPLSVLLAVANIALFVAFTGSLLRTLSEEWSGDRRWRWTAAERIVAGGVARVRSAELACRAFGRRVGAWFARPSFGDRLGVGSTLLLVTVLAGLPVLSLQWMNGHDAFAYLPRNVEFWEGLRAGALVPRWAPDLGFGYGEPTFNFNPPLLYYSSAWFHALGFNFVASENLTILALLSASAGAMFCCARTWFGTRGAIVAATAYVFAPYLQERLYVSHALADYAAFPFIPLAFWGLYRYGTGGALRFLLVGTAGAAGIVLSSSSSALIMFPVLTAFVCWIAVRERRWDALARGGWCLLLAVGITAFSWFPALAEAQFVHIDRRALRIDYHDQFLTLRQLLWAPWGFGLAPDGISLALGPVYLAITAAAVLAWRAIARASHAAGAMVVFVLAMMLVAIFFTTRASLPLWELLSPLHPLQFPWRFLQPVAFGTAFLCGFPLLLVRARPVASALSFAALMVALIAFGLPHAGPQGYVARAESEFSPTNIAAQGIAATAREFEPIWVERFPGTASTRQLAMVSGRGSVLAAKVEPFARTYLVDVSEAGTAQVETFDFPGWRLTVNGEARPIRHDNPSGLMRFELAPGPHAVELRFGSTAARSGATLASLAALIALAGTSGLRQWRRRRVLQPPTADGVRSGLPPA